MPSTVRTACQCCSVSETAFFSWVRRGEKGEKVYAQFAQRLMRARGLGKIKILRSIWDSDDVRVKLEALSRIYPDEFARVERPQPQPEPPEKKINVAFIVDTKGKSLEEVASFPVLTPEEIAQKAPEREPEPTAGELFDGNISKLGRVVHDVPFDGNGG